MNNEKDKELDDLFKKGLADPGDHQNGYKDADWDAFEQLLDGGKKRRIIAYWIPVLSSVAAMLLLFFGWWAVTQKINTSHPGDIKSQVKIQLKKDTGISGGATRQAMVSKKTSKVIGAGSQGNSFNVSTGKGINSFEKLYAAGARRADTGNGILPGGTDGDKLTASNTLAGLTLTPLNAPELTPVELKKPVANDDDRTSNKFSVKLKNAFRPVYAISVLAAPDINGVGSSFQQGKIGTNVGLIFAVGVSKKLTISTGALYSVKPYMTSFSNYHTPYQFQTNPLSVAADCRMLDIPLNVGYQVYHHYQTKISVGTGLSSYIMLHENYSFNYASINTANPVYYEVRKPGNYFFGVMNINATYERQLNSKVGITLQPYIKLPLTNIGYSQVKLQTTGIAVGLTWNLNSLSKP